MPEEVVMQAMVASRLENFLFNILVIKTKSQIPRLGIIYAQHLAQDVRKYLLQSSMTVKVS